MPTFSRLQIKICIMLIVILAVTVGSNNWISTSIYKKQYSAALQSKWLVIGEGLNNQLDRILKLGISLEEIIGFDEQCKEIVRKYNDIDMVTVVDSSGIVIFSSEETMKGSQLKSAELTETTQMGQITTAAFHTENSQYIGSILPYFDQTHERVLGASIIFVKSTIINKKLSEQMTYPILLTLIFFVISFLLILSSLSRWVTRPLGSMVHHMKEVAAGNLMETAEANDRDEIGQLGTAFNYMVGRVGDLLHETAQSKELEIRYESALQQRLLAEKMRHVISEVSATLEIDKVMERILICAQVLISYKTASLWMLEDGELLLKVVQPTGAVQPYKSRDTWIHQFEELESFQMPIIKSGEVVTDMFVPIMIDSRVSGMLCLQNDEPYTVNEKTLAFTYTSQVGAFIQNAQLYQQMQWMATTDALTGIFNRGHFFAEASRYFEKEEHEHAGIVMFDIDHFKSVNDQFGHPVGDHVLNTTAQMIKRYLPGDRISLFSRYGGEEFVILFIDTSDEFVKQTAEGIRSLIEHLEMQTSKGLLKVTVSIGVAFRRTSDDSLAEVLKHADAALYEAKAYGRNQVK